MRPWIMRHPFLHSFVQRTRRAVRALNHSITLSLYQHTESPMLKCKILSYPFDFLLRARRRQARLHSCLSSLLPHPPPLYMSLSSNTALLSAVACPFSSSSLSPHAARRRRQRRRCVAVRGKSTGAGGSRVGTGARFMERVKVVSDLVLRPSFTPLDPSTPATRLLLA